MPNEDTPQELVLPASLTVYTARSQDDKSAFLIRRSEWSRLKRAAQKIKPLISWWSIAASVFAGLALSCAVNWWVARGSKTPDFGSINANGYLCLIALTATILCVLADRGQRGRTTEDAESLLYEIDVIERSNPDVFPFIDRDNG